tara:strand:- start:575 stop:1291 length:717 start_codon:yes stop_codon:yes gene_type:complete
MPKKDLNQNTKYYQELINSVDYNFDFNEQPLNRFKTDIQNTDLNVDKFEQLLNLKQKINSIENCKLKNNSKKLIMGDGNVNSPIMLIGESPSNEEEVSEQTFKGQSGELLKKMFIAINVRIENIYKTYSINFRPPEDRKPSSHEIKRYAVFLKEHISIISPKIIILMGSTAMEAVTGLNNKISNERGKWKEIILKNRTIPLMITFSPSYLIRFPENKKYSWTDLKKIRQKIRDLNIKV